MQRVTKWVRPWTTAIIRSCCSGVASVHCASSRQKMSSRDSTMLFSARAGQTMIVWWRSDCTVGPNNGCNPITLALDLSMAATGAVLSEVKSQRSWSGVRTGEISSMTRTVSWMGTDTMTRSHCSARSVFVSRVDLPETSTSYPARSKTGANSLPIFPVPPIIPAFMDHFSRIVSLTAIPKCLPPSRAHPMTVSPTARLTTDIAVPSFCTRRIVSAFWRIRLTFAFPASASTSSRGGVRSWCAR